MANIIYDFNSKVSIIRDKIEALSLHGIDTSEIVKELDQIINDTTFSFSNIGLSNSQAIQSMQSDSVYISSMKLLNKIESVLDDYDAFFKIKNSIALVKDILASNQNIDYEKIDKMLIQLINDIRNTNLLDFDELSKVSCDIYFFSYEIIKRELMKSGKSPLLEYIKTSEKGIEFINDYIRNETESIDLYKYPSIKIKYMELMSKGVNYSLLDASFILSLCMISHPHLKEQIKSEIKDNSINATYYEDKLYEKDGKIVEKTKDKRNIECKIKKDRIKAGLLTLGIILNGLTASHANKKLTEKYTEENYATTLACYDTLTEEQSIETTYRPESKVGDATISVYGKKILGSRSVSIYEMDQDRLPNYEDIDLIDFDRLEKIDHYHIDDENNLKDGYIKVETVTGINKNDSKMILDQERFKSAYSNTIYLIYLCSIILGTNLSAFLTSLGKNKKYLKELNEIIAKTIKQYNENLEEYKSTVERSDSLFNILGIPEKDKPRALRRTNNKWLAK